MYQLVLFQQIPILLYPFLFDIEIYSENLNANHELCHNVTMEQTKSTSALGITSLTLSL